MNRVNELTRNESSKRDKSKSKNPEKVNLMAIEKYLRDLEAQAIEDK